MKPRSPHQTCSHGAETAELMMVRARRELRRKRYRTAMLRTRAAVCQAPDSARLWTLLAAYSLRAGKFEEAERALRQALWLRRQQRDEARRIATESLLRGLLDQRALVVSAA